MDRTKKIVCTQDQKTRLARLILALPKAESVDPIAQPPWLARETRTETTTHIYGPQGRSKAKAAEDLTTSLATLPPKDIQVFQTDQKANLQTAPLAATGGGSVTYQYGLQIDRKPFSLGCNAEVFDAEAAAALRGAQAALAAPSANFATDMWVFLDNLEVTMRLLAPSNGSSKSVFDDFCEVARQWPLCSAGSQGMSMSRVTKKPTRPQKREPPSPHRRTQIAPLHH